MKLLLSTLCIALLSFAHSSYALVDPDSLDPSMPVVSYLIPAENLQIVAYRLGSPSKLKVKLCRECFEKTYDLSPSAEFRLLNQRLDKTKLTEVLLKRELSQIRLAVNRRKGVITYLFIGASPNDEFSSTPFLKLNNPTRTEGAK
jgi:hypothetical protein